MWKKICAVLGGILAAAFGIFSFVFEHQKRKMVEEQLNENKKKSQALQEELDKVHNGDKQYVEYKKKNEELVTRAIGGDFDAGLDILQNAAESGKKRNGLK